MKDGNVVFVEKDTIFPMFGVADPVTEIAWVRKDLPGPVRDFVTAHELCHLQDSARWWLWREIKANAAGAWEHPWGFVRCVWMSATSWERLKYYCRRFRRGE